MWNDALHRWLRVPYTLNVRLRKRVKRPKATVLFIHGIGASGAMWDEVIKDLSKDVDIVTIDLLGFGRSPRPTWAVYSAKTQARSVVATILKLRLRGRVILVGHSLGALVAVETAKRYPLLIKSLILCSPPFYSNRETKLILSNPDKVLRNMYVAAQKHPDQIVKISALALKYGLVNKAFDVTSDNVDSYVAALEASIINQTSLEDAKRLRLPTHIIHGRFDPVVIKKNLKEVMKQNPNVTFSQILAGHEVKGLYVGAVQDAVRNVIDTK
ncbi:MAG TPA: alpha/beta hydrolase [Candidatus Saccharimonadales bacterium]